MADKKVQSSSTLPISQESKRLSFDPYIANLDQCEDFFRAVIKGDSATVKAYVEWGVDISALSHDGSTAIQLAKKNGRKEIARYLVTQQVKKAKDEKKISEKPTTSLLIKLSNLDKALTSGAKTDDPRGYPLAHFKKVLQANINNIEIICLLLLTAIVEDDVEEVKMVLDTGKIPLDSEFHDDHNPLQAAVLYGSNATIDYLIRHGANQKIKDKLGCNLVFISFMAGQYQTMKNLIIRNPDSLFETNNRGLTPVHCFIFLKGTRSEIKFSEQQTILQQLIPLKGRHVLEVPDRRGFKPLHTATSTGEFPLVNWLVAQGVNVSAPDPAGLYPFHVAIEKHFIEIAEVIFKKNE